MARPSSAKVWIYRFRDPAGKMAQLLTGHSPHYPSPTRAASGESILGHRLPGVAGVYNVYAYADEMRKWLDRWAEHVAGIVAPRAKPARAKR